MVFTGTEKVEEQTDRVGPKRTSAIRNYFMYEQGIDSLRIRFVSLPQDSLITHRSNSIYHVGFWVD